MNTAISVISKLNLCFKAPDLFSERGDETFTIAPLDPTVERAALGTIHKVLSLLEDRFLPSRIEVAFEEFGEMHFPDGFVEQIPISLIVSHQQPPASAIRLGTFETKGDIVALSSILAHELGHMLIEWPCRLAGVTSPNDFVLNHWSKPIYEGVADWVAAVTMDCTTIGSSKSWFKRDLFTYASLDAARAAVGAMPALLEAGLKSTGLVPTYRAYSEWLKILGEHLKDKADPYAEGTWIAAQLWRGSSGARSASTLASKIVDLAVTGRPFNDAREFLGALAVH